MTAFIKALTNHEKGVTDMAVLQGAGLYETPKIRCLACQRRVSDDIYMLLCGVEHCLPDYYFDTEERTGYHLHVILEGKGVLSVNGKETELHFGQMFMTKPDEDTWYKADSEDPWVYCWMAFDGNLAADCAERAGFVKGVNVQECYIDPDEFYNLCKRVLDLAEVSPAHVLMRTGLLMEFVALAVESHYKSDQGGKKSHEYSTDVYVKYAADFIRGNYATAKISDVAKYIGIHRSYLTNIFKNKMGISPQEYLIQCKLKRAAKFLTETDNPIQEISRQIGYDNPLTFSKTFKNFYGISPKFYRQQHKADES